MSVHDLGVVGSACLCVAAGCQPYERVVSHRPFMGSISGVQSDTPIAPEPRMVNRDLHIVPGNGEVRQFDENGDPILYARAGFHVLLHTLQTIDNGEQQLFFDQVASERAKQGISQMGLTESEAFENLSANRSKIAELLRRLPGGDLTPGLRKDLLGDNTFRYRVSSSVQVQSSQTSVDLTGVRESGGYNAFDVRWEDGNYRLVQFLNVDLPRASRW